jgi:DNA-binding transcriptional MerR regulator
MPLKEKTIERMYWSIGEVADELGVKASLLRYWEREFGTLRPKRTNKGDRLYTKDDIEQLRRIQHLVKEEGFTLQGAKGQLRRPEPPQASLFSVEEMRDKLLRVRERLMELRDRSG